MPLLKVKINFKQIFPKTKFSKHHISIFQIYILRKHTMYKINNIKNYIIIFYKRKTKKY